MKTALSLATLVLLAACQTTVPSGLADYSYKPGERGPATISEMEYEQLTGQVVDFRAQRSTLLEIVRTSPDPATRARHQAGIEDLTGKIQYVEYRLRSAGRPLPRN